MGRKEIIEETSLIYLELLKDICRMETPSENKAAIDSMSRVIEAFARERGFEVERIPFTHAGDYLRIDLAGDSALPPVLLMAHMDTVHPIGAFGPDVIRQEGDWLHGPGVMDCKGGIITALFTMDVIKRSGENHRPVTVLLTSDEEISGRLSGESGFDLMRSLASQSCAVLNCEAGKEGELTVGRSGILRLRVEVSGIASHSGNNYFGGASAVREAAYQIIKIENESSADCCTFNCGIINGGSSINTVPASCVFLVDIRAAKMEQLNQGMEHVIRSCQKTTVPGTSCQVTKISVRPPMEQTPANEALLQKINAAAAQLGLPLYRSTYRGGGSDAAYTVQAGAPTVCSCGMVGSGEHTLAEKVRLSSLTNRTAVLVQTIQGL